MLKVVYGVCLSRLYIVKTIKEKKSKKKPPDSGSKPFGGLVDPKNMDMLA